ncbi:melatonin receptor type 1B-like [Ptychodera flava]|uniref:melatonin receptor type 1B-like n=1 Tax=Ptychodera flava TaxID=63121 RepID=UPI00396A34BE
MNSTADVYELTAAVIAEALSLSVISSVGIVGNILVLLSSYFYSGRLTKYALSVFIVNLGIADLSLTMFYEPLIVGAVLIDAWPFGLRFCEISATVILICSYASINFLAVIAVHNYVLIMKNSQLYAKIFTKKACALISLFGWVFAILCSLNMVVNQNRLQYSPEYHQCRIDFTKIPVVEMVPLTLCGFTLPCTIIAFCYCSIYITVKRSRRRVAAPAFAISTDMAVEQARQVRRRKENVKLAFSMFLVVAAFVICFLPFQTVYLLTLFGIELPYFVSRSADFINTLNYSINPIIYAWRNDQYRVAFKKILLGRCFSRRNMNNKWAVKPSTGITPVS